MKLHIINHTRDGIVVHKAGCADVAKTLRQPFNVNSDWQIEVPDGTDAATAVMNDLNKGFGWTPGCGEDQPWHTSDIKVLPCCKK